MGREYRGEDNVLLRILFNFSTLEKFYRSGREKILLPTFNLLGGREIHQFEEGSGIVKEMRKVLHCSIKRRTKLPT